MLAWCYRITARTCWPGVLGSQLELVGLVSVSMTGLDCKFNLQFLSWCGSMYNRLCRYIPEAHLNVAGMLSKQPAITTRQLKKWFGRPATLARNFLMAVMNMLNSPKDISELSFENADVKSICSCKQRMKSKLSPFLRICQNTRSVSCAHLSPHTYTARVEWCGVGH